MEDPRSELAEQDPLRVVAGVVFDGEDILACRRKPDNLSGGLWEFPGGKSEPGETPVAALIREIREELSVSVLVDDELSTDVTPVFGGSIELICIRARLAGARPVDSTDHDRILWLRAADLDQLEWAAPDRPAVRRLMATDDALLRGDDQSPQGELAPDVGTLPRPAFSGSWATSPSVRRSMLGNRARDTRPELEVRRIVHGMGLRYQVDHRPAPQLHARGDLVFPRQRIVVFIDGCFWHGCPEHYRAPKSNAAYWSAKLAANRSRDSRTTEALTELGWTVLRFWAHQDPGGVAESIKKTVLDS